jgi:hypothetical protein
MAAIEPTQAATQREIIGIYISTLKRTICENLTCLAPLRGNERLGNHDDDADDDVEDVVDVEDDKFVDGC